jgi:hypothetical protein
MAAKAESIRQVRDAIIKGKYVAWVGRWSSGVVVGVQLPDTIVMQSSDMEYKPFKAGWHQSLANGYQFEICGDSEDDWQM